MWVVQPRERQRFIAESFPACLVSDTCGEFQCDVALKLFVERAKNDPHAALSNLFDNAITPKRSASSGDCGHVSPRIGAASGIRFSCQVWLKASANVSGKRRLWPEVRRLVLRNQPKVVKLLQIQ